MARGSSSHKLLSAQATRAVGIRPSFIFESIVPLMTRSSFLPTPGRGAGAFLSLPCELGTQRTLYNTCCAPPPAGPSPGRGPRGRPPPAERDSNPSKKTMLFLFGALVKSSMLALLDPILADASAATVLP